MCIIKYIFFLDFFPDHRSILDGPGGPYFIVPLGIVIGLGLPVIPWYLYKRYGWPWLKFVNTAVLAGE